MPDAVALILLAALTPMGASLDLDRMLAIGSFALLLAAQILTWRAMGRGESRREVKLSAEEATAQADQTNAIRDLTKSNDRMADALEALRSWAREHERSDDKWQAAANEVQKSMLAAIQRLTDLQENFQGQLSNVVRDMPPIQAREVPANRRR